MSISTDTQEAQLESSITRKFSTRVLWILLLMMFFSVTDRASLGYAGPGGMNEELGLSATAFGFAAGIFFFGYVIFEIPSSAGMRRYGARVWLPRILVTWGIAQLLMAFSVNDIMLYGLRVVLGAAEAGLVPCALAYLAVFLPQSRRALIYSIFMFAGTLSVVVMGPISLALISWGDSLNIDFAGWRVLFVVTGIAPIVVGVVAYFVLPNAPANARWLTDQERAYIDAANRAESADGKSHSFFAGLKSGTVWLLGIAYFFLPFGSYILIFFLPTVLANWQKDDPALNVPVLSMVPYAIAAVVSIMIGFSVSRLGRAGIHVAACLVVGLVGAGIILFTEGHVANFVGLCLVTMGATAPIATFFSIVPKLYAAAAAASALALVNSLGVLSGFVGPYLAGVALDVTGSITPVFIIVFLGYMFAAVVTIGADVIGERRLRALSAESATAHA